MTKSNNSVNGSEKETTVIVVDFKNKVPVAVLKNKSDDEVLCYLILKGMAPQKPVHQELGLIGGNVLLFSKVA